MLQTLEPRTRSWLNWEWRAALITIVGGLITALAVMAYIHFSKPSPQALEAAQRAKLTAVVQTAAEVCTQALAAAKNFGLVPNYASLGTMFPAATQVKGRYVCASRTPVAQYNIAIDLLCRDLKNPHCTLLYSVVQPDGTVLYKRQS
jgi:hypothetical protein